MRAMAGRIGRRADMARQKKELGRVDESCYIISCERAKQTQSADLDCRRALHHPPLIVVRYTKRIRWRRL